MLLDDQWIVGCYTCNNCCQCECQWHFLKIFANWLLYLKVWAPIKHTGHMTIIASNKKVLPPELLSEWKQWVMGRNVKREKRAEMSLSVCPTGKPCQRRKKSDSFRADTRRELLRLLHLQSQSYLVSIQEWQEKRQQHSLVAFLFKSDTLTFQVKMCKSDCVAGHA